MDRKEALEEQGCYYDPIEPDNIIRWIEENCPLTLGEKACQKVQLIPWLAEAIREMYGWRRQDGSRATREADIWCPKKNSKSYLSSCLSIYTAANVPSSQVQIIASSRDQARVIYDECKRQLSYGPQSTQIGKGLRWVFRDSSKEIFYYNDDGLQSRIHVLPGSDKTSGHPFHLCLFDECIDVRPNLAGKLYDTIVGGGKATNGLFILTSTPKFDLSHWAHGKWMKSKEQLENCTDPFTYHVLYTVPDDAKCICGQEHGEGWRCPEWWWRANPGIDYCLRRDDFHADYARVLAEPEYARFFRTLGLGQWVSSSDIPFIAPHKWSACKTDIEESDLYGEEMIIALDGSRKHDLFALVGIVHRDGIYHLIDRAWIPAKRALVKEQVDAAPYTLWHREGWLHYSDGDTISPEDVYQEILALKDNFTITEIRMDQRGLWDFADRLAKEFPITFLDQQPASMTSPTARFEQLVDEHKIKHSGSPLFAWCLEGCRPDIARGANDFVVLRKSKATHRIDLVIAAIIGLSFYMGNEQTDEWLGWIG